MSFKTLAGKAAIVTGGSKGIGGAIAVELARRGAQGIAITYHNDISSAEKVVSIIKSYGADSVAIQADVLDSEFGSKVVAASVAALNTNTIDILVNNAVSTEMAHFKPIAAVELDDFESNFQGSLFSVLSCTLAVLPHLPASGGGRIINISSAEAQDASSDPTVLYGAAKAALNHLTRSLAKMYGKEKRCTINSVSVGPTETDALRRYLSSMAPEVEQTIAGFTIEQRLGTVDDIAQVVAFLASEESRWINGNVVPASGGFRS